MRAALAGASVGLVDAGARIPPATIAAAGMLAPSFERPDAPLMQALFDLHRSALKKWAEFDVLLREFSPDGVDLRLNGIIGLAQSDAERRLQEKHVEAARNAGLECEQLDEAALKELEPAIGVSRFGGVFSAEEGQVDPLLLSRALAQACDDVGVSTLANSMVERIESENDMWRLTIDDGRRCEAQSLVLATGARAVLTTDHPPLAPVKGEALAVASTAIDHVIRTQNAYLCPKSDGRLVIGATEYEGKSDTSPDAAAVDLLRSRAEVAVPGLVGAREISRWAGVRPGSPDGAPILGAAPGRPGLYFALGGYRNGILQAPLVSELLIDLIVSNRASAAIETFGARRFHLASTGN